MEAALTSVVVKLLEPWVNSLPPLLMQKELIKARSQVWAARFILVRVDRSPGRVMVICRELWAKLQQNTFLENLRYQPTGVRPSADDTNYAESLRESFLNAVPNSAEWAARRPSGGSSRSRCYWTIKQKSLIVSLAEPVVKVRPIVTHRRHPLRMALKRVARALAVLVCEARLLVLKRLLDNLPTWQLHSGSAEWLERLATTKGWWSCEEYDVADCFLNTSREAVLAALAFWLTTTQQRSRRWPAFSISKGWQGWRPQRTPCMCSLLDDHRGAAAGGLRLGPAEQRTFRGAGPWDGRGGCAGAAEGTAHWGPPLGRLRGTARGAAV